MKILVINGPNLNMLGIREPDIYGRQTFADLEAFIREVCARERIEVECFQSNHEGALVDIIQSALGKADGIVIQFVVMPSSLFIGPTGDKSIRTIPQSTMTEMKFGA